MIPFRGLGPDNKEFRVLEHISDPAIFWEHPYRDIHRSHRSFGDCAIARLCTSLSARRPAMSGSGFLKRGLQGRLGYVAGIDWPPLISKSV